MSSSPCGPPQFAGVLHALSVAGCDALYAAVREAGAVRAARLACKALRRALDGSVRSVCLRVTCRDDDLEGEPQPWPALGPWPRCEAVRAYVDAEGDSASSVLLPFMAAPHATAPHILRLSLSSSSIVETFTDAELTVATLVPRLPSLRVLDLIRWPFSSSACAQTVMFSALASHPRLEELWLSNNRCLDHAAPLARLSTLRRLRVVDFDDEDTFTLSAQAAACIASLGGLQRLELAACTHVLAAADESYAGLAELLQSLPASLTSLQIRYILHVALNPPIELGCTHGAYELRACLEGGKLSKLEVQDRSGGMGAVKLGQLAAVLQGSRTMPDRLPYMEVGDVFYQPQLLQHQELARSVRTLVSCRCGRFVWRALRIVEWEPTAAEVAQLLDVLGLPEQVLMDCGVAGSYRPLAVTLGDQQQQQQAERSANDAGPYALPEPEAVLCAALRRVGNAAEAAGGGGSVAAADALQLVLLSGPQVVALLGGDAASLGAWVCGLADGSSSSSSSSSSAEGGMVSCQAVPAAGALLVSCSSATAVAAAAEAAQKVEGVHAVAVAWKVQGVRTQPECLWSLLEALEQELQHTWAPAFRRAARRDWQAHAKWLLSVRRAVRDLPPVVQLS